MTINAGRLDRRITIERADAPSQSASGEPQLVWAALAGPLWAEIVPVRGSEGQAEPGRAAHQDVEITIRHSAAVADVNPKDRVNHRGELFDILELHEIGRRVGLRLIARRKAD